MTDRLALGRAAPVLRRLAAATGGARTRARIERLAAIAQAAPHENELSVGAVADALFVDDGGGDAVARLRALRSALNKLARAQGIELAFVVDGQKHAPPRARRCWFTGADDSAQRIEQLSRDTSEAVAGSTPVSARARRAVRVCVDAVAGAYADDLTAALQQALRLDHELDVEVHDTRALPGLSPTEVRAARLRSADVVVCLLSHAFLGEHRRDEVADVQIVVPVALEPLGARIDLRGFQNPFTLQGKSFAECAGQRRAAFVGGLHDAIVARLHPPAVDCPPPDAGRWQQLVGTDPGDVVLARGRRISLERESVGPAGPAAIDDTVDVQEHLRAWADDPAGRPYMVVFGEYGMGKTTACQVFTRAQLDRRGDGARLPIYLDLRRLGDVKLREPTLEQILDDLLARAWQSGGGQPPATAAEVIEQVQRGRAVVIFDGLDEVLVSISVTQGQAFLRELWKILPPRLLSDPAAHARLGRVLLTCRTHFFRTLREQRTYFRGEDREPVGGEAYAALHLLPFDEQQIRAYLQLRLQGGARIDSVERALQLIRDVHDLRELAERPHNLRLVADQLGAIERRVAGGGRVDAAALYEDLVASWLERDTGKHQLRPADKLRLMEELAATLWRGGRRSLSVDELEEWLHERLDEPGPLARWFRLSGADVGVLAEDLRTATFVVRPDEDRFEFAHSSLLEYFLARRLARAFAGADGDACAMPLPSVETLDFLGEIIAAGDAEACRHGLRSLLRGYRDSVSELAFAYCVRAWRRGAPAIALRDLDLTGARLRGIEIEGPAGAPPLVLAGCRFAGADLRDARLRRVSVEGCDLASADLTCAEVHDGALRDVGLHDAQLAGLIVRGCTVADVDLRGARAHRTQWLRCELRGVEWPAGAGGHFVAASAGAPPAPVPDRARAQLAALHGHVGPVNAVAFSPDSERLASAGTDGRVRIFDAATAQPLHTIDAHTRWVQVVVFSPDRLRLASAGDDGRVRIFDAATGECLHAIDAHTDVAQAVAFSRDSQRLTSAGNDGRMCIFDAATGQLLHTVDGHTSWAQAIAFSPDGLRLAVGDHGRVHVCDAASAQPLYTVDARIDSARAVAFSPEGQRLATAGTDGCVCLFDAASGQPLHVIYAHDRWAQAVAFSPDGQRLASAGNDGRIRLFDAASARSLHTVDAGTNGARAIEFSPDGERLASASDDGVVRLFDVAVAQPLHTIGAGPFEAQAIAFSPDGRLASAGGDGLVRVFDAVAGQPLHVIDAHKSWTQAVAFSPDGRRVATAGGDGQVRLFDAASGQIVRVIDSHFAWAHAVVFSPDGQRLASAGADGTVRLFDPSTGEALHAIHAHPGGTGAVVFSPDGQRLASAGAGGTVRLFDPFTGQALHTIDAHAGGAGAVVFSPDGQRLASAGDDGRVRIFDAATAQSLHTIDAHTDWARAAAFSPDGQRLASAGDDGRVRIFDAATAQPLHTIDAHTHWARALVFSPDGRRLASAGYDGRVVLWDPADATEQLAIEFADDDFAVWAAGRLTACSGGAWRWLGWLAPDPQTGALERYPAELFGPLPVVG